MRFKKIVRLFEQGSVCVCGLRGKGKDVLFGNVIARRKKCDYISNLDYTNGVSYIPFKYDDIDIKNDYSNLISGNLNYYSFPYEYGTDIYLSDVGIYFPSQYNNLLNRDYKGLPVYMALSRQVSRNNVHINVQNLNRAWDKIREQSDTYITCNSCKIIFGICFMSITLYDKMESCCNRVRPCRITIPLFAKKEVKLNARIYRDDFFNKHGTVKKRILIFKNKSKHNTYAFEEYFKKGVI